MYIRISKRRRADKARADTAYIDPAEPRVARRGAWVQCLPLDGGEAGCSVLPLAPGKKRSKSLTSAEDAWDAVWFARAPKRPATPEAPCVRNEASWRTAMLSARQKRRTASGTMEGAALDASERSWRRHIIMVLRAVGSIQIPERTFLTRRHVLVHALLSPCAGLAGAVMRAR